MKNYRRVLLLFQVAVLWLVMGLLSGCADKSAPVSFVDFTATPTLEGSTLTPTPMAIPVRPTATPLPSVHLTVYPTETPVEGVDIQIGEKMFIAQCNDVYLNAPDYIGKIIQLEGLYKRAEYPFQGKLIVEQYVMRYGPGCCGNDGSAGFEINYDGPALEDNAWVRATGTLDMVPREGSDYFRLVLRIMQLTELEERGKEFVLQ